MADLMELEFNLRCNKCPYDSLSSREKTGGAYYSEKTSAEAFDNLINLNLWVVHKEVNGHLMHPRPFANGTNNLRIDRLLIPTNELINMGWNLGAVGIEIKASNKLLGPIISQVLDYQRCIWKLKNGIMIACSHYFIWELNNLGENLQSIMAQNRIGEAYCETEVSGKALCLRLSSKIIFNQYGCNTDLTIGNKVGSR